MKARVKVDWALRDLKKGELVERKLFKDRNYYAYYKNGKWICDEGSPYGERYFEIVTSPTISLKLEGVEEGEKFNIRVGDGSMSDCNPHYIRNANLYNRYNNICNPLILTYLISGESTIEKIPQKTETELEIEKLRAQVAEFNAQIDKLEGTL